MNNTRVELLKNFKDEFRMDLDPWGHAMDWFFTVAHVIYCVHGPSAVPKEWDYRPGMAINLEPDEYPLVIIYDLILYSYNDLVFLGNCLHRITRQLTKMGRDY